MKVGGKVEIYFMVRPGATATTAGTARTWDTDADRRNRMGGLICGAWGIVGPLCRAAMAGRKRAPQLKFANMANF